MPPKIAIVGGGMSAGTLIHTFNMYKTQVNVTLFTTEPCLPYRRLALHDLVGVERIEDSTMDKIMMVTPSVIEALGIEVITGEVKSIDRASSTLQCNNRTYSYDWLVLATGSDTILPKTDLKGIFRYRNLDDVKKINTHIFDCNAKRCVILGGDLRGTEAASTFSNIGMDVTIICDSGDLMSEYMPSRASLTLKHALKSNRGIKVVTRTETEEFVPSEERKGYIGSVRVDNEEYECDLVVVTGRLIPATSLASSTGLDMVDNHVIVNEKLQTSDSKIFAVGECVSLFNMTFNFNGPIASQANTLALRLMGSDFTAPFVHTISDNMLLFNVAGIDVAIIGDANGSNTPCRSLEYISKSGTVYRQINVSLDEEEVIGGVLIGRAEDFSEIASMCRGEMITPEGTELEKLVYPLSLNTGNEDIEDYEMADEEIVCMCKNIKKGTIVDAVRRMDIENADQVTQVTNAGSGCTGCVPLINLILTAELKKLGKAKKQIKGVCEKHFPEYTRSMLYDLVKEDKYMSYSQIYEAIALKPDEAVGRGCHACKIAIANVLSSVNHQYILGDQSIQADNDRYLANIQRGGTYSVIPRQPGGEVSPEQLLVFAELAKKFNLYLKITSQRIGLFGVRIQNLQEVWQRLGEAGLETGGAYSKALRNVSACVGLPWCTSAMGRSVDFSVRLENRYKNIRSPHKIKGGIAGCLRDCAEAKAKDFGLVAVGQSRWNVYVGGNAGVTPRQSEMVVSNVSEDEAVKILDRFLMLYIERAQFGQRTAQWVSKLTGGVGYIKSVIIDDSEGIADELEAEMEELVSRTKHEWHSVTSDPNLAVGFREFGNHPDLKQTSTGASAMNHEVRGHREPADWPEGDVESVPIAVAVENSKNETHEYVMVALTDDVLIDQGMNYVVGDHQVAVFRLSSTSGDDEWRAVQSKCPHKGDMIFHRGITGTNGGAPTVACPFHKKVFNLDDGSCVTHADYSIRVIPIEIRNKNEIWISNEVKNLCNGDSHTSLEW